MKIIKYILLVSLNINATSTIKGDVAQPITTFSFSLLEKLAFDPSQKNLYACTNQQISDGLAQQYGISVLLTGKNYNVFIPLLTPDATVNGILQPNPLIGQSITDIILSSFVNSKIAVLLPFVVASNQPNIVNALLNIPAISGRPTQIIATAPLTDSLLDVNSEIVALSGVRNGFLAAVCTAGTLFGDVGSNSVLNGNTFQESVAQDAIDTPSYYTYSFAPSFFIPFDNNLAALSTNGAPVVLQPGAIAMHTDEFNELCYTGSIITSNNGKSVTLLGQSVIPSAVCSADSIIASTTQPVSAIKITTFITTTNLLYMAVLGGVGAAAAADKNQVYAFPLINDRGSTEFGQIASKNEIPTLTFATFYPYAYQNSLLSQAPVVPADVYSTTDREVRVGGGPLDLAPAETYTIEQLYSHQDCIFAQGHYTGVNINASSGLFYSQALFDENQKIAGWSRWQRKALVGDYQYSLFNPWKGHQYAIPGALVDDSYSVVETVWTQNSYFNNFEFATIVSLPLQNGGVQGVIDIPHSYPAPGVTSASYLMQVGYQTVILQQTALNNSAVINFPKSSFISINGTLAGFPGTATSIVSCGGALEKSTALITGSLAFSKNIGAFTDSWFVVGGSNGVLILANPDGTGCGPNGPGDNFNNLAGTMSWQQFGSFKNVKKLWYDDGMLYVLTNNSLSRIELNAAQVALGNGCTTVTLAQANQLSNQVYPSFADVIVSAKFCLLATSAGLYRIGSGANIKTAQNFYECIWTPVFLPEGPQAVVNLCPITRTGISADFSRTDLVGVDPLATGNINVLSSAVGIHQGRIYRFACYDTVQSPITDTTLRPINSYFVQNRPSYFINPDSECMSTATDGASWYINAPVSNGLFFKGYLAMLPPYLRSGNPIPGIPEIVFTTTQYINDFLTAAVFISGLGSWGVGTLYGIYTLG